MTRSRVRLFPVFLMLLAAVGVVFLLANIGAAGEAVNVGRLGTGARVKQPGAPPQARVPDWIAGRQVSVPQGLTISPHAKKHVGQGLDAWKIYALLLAGRCVASMQFNYCGKQGYVCIDPETGLIGGIFVVAGKNLITSGFAAKDGYWYERISEGAIDDNRCRYAIW